MLAHKMQKFWHTFARSHPAGSFDDGVERVEGKEKRQMGIEGHLWGSDELPYSLADLLGSTTPGSLTSQNEDTVMEPLPGALFDTPTLEDLSIARAAHEMLERVLAAPVQRGIRAGRYLRALTSALDSCPHGAMEQAIVALYKARSRGRRVYVLGLGEHAPVASYLAADLSRQQVQAVQLSPIWRASSREDVVVPSSPSAQTTKPNPTTTTPSNRVTQRLERHLRATLRGGDVLLLIDDESGADPLDESVVALRTARACGATTLVLGGSSTAHVEHLAPVADEFVPVGCSGTAMLASAYLYLGTVLATTLGAMERACPSGPLAAVSSSARRATFTDEARWKLA